MNANVAVGAVVIAAAVLAACSDDRASVAAGSGVVTTAPASVTSTPAAPATETLSDRSRLRVDGIGPVVVGMTADEVRSAAGIELTLVDGPYCDGLESQIPGLHLVVIDDRLALITIDQPPIETAADLHVGSSGADVLSAFAGGIAAPSPGRLVVHLSDPTFEAVSMVFDVQDGIVVQISAGLRNATEADEACA